ncbi:MAG: UDP-N-acetylmuramoyl-tripeptide--D-alanyl-D-alanine ligase [Patescibacteria group bacterium]
MKQKLLAWKLSIWSRMILWRYRPTIIAITGNAGKTTTKEAIAAVLATKYRVRATGGNLNNELGIPATIIGDFSEQYYRTGGTFPFWFKVLTAAVRVAVYDSTYPQVLVLEFGADRPGDIKRLARMFPPHIAVVTQVGDIPVHVEYFASPKELAAEKAQILKHLLPTDYAILGYDDLTVLEMRETTNGRTLTYGMGDGADVQVTDVRTRLEGTRPLGISFDVRVQNNTMPVAINGTLGSGIARAAAAAVAVGSIMNIGLADAVQALADLRSPAGRLRILEGIRSTVLVDDTYNASPAATHLAIDSVRHIPAARHVLVLGDMLELGSYSVQAHQAVGTLAAIVADILVCVGERGRFIADAAGNQMPAANIHWAPDSRAAAGIVQQLVRAGDLVLVKGSQGMRMERIVQELMLRPEQAPHLLVRQSVLWLSK